VCSVTSERFIDRADLATECRQIDQPNRFDWSERPPKRTLKQVQVVLDRLYEEVSGERVIRAIFHSYFPLPTFVLTEAILRGVKVWQTRSL
jgi:hypothetical protein